MRIAILGATGAVGKEVLKVLEDRKFPVDDVRLLASHRSVGIKMRFRGEEKLVEEFRKNCFDGVDMAIFSANSVASKDAALMAKAAGCGVVIDNSTAFRMDDEVPLVIPEINARDIGKHKGIIANPNCTTAITLMALWPLHQEFGVKRIIASSYQAVSGIGAQGIEQLDLELESGVSPEMYEKLMIKEPSVFKHPIAFNVIPQVDQFQPSGYTKEEEKMQNEGRKIMHHPTFKASVTCVRVPVYRAHSISVCAEFEKPVSIRDAQAVLKNSPGVQLRDETEQSVYPMPKFASGKYDCFVGRIRKDAVFDNGLSFFVCGDQLLKGAALNAVQIAEHLIR